MERAADFFRYLIDDGWEVLAGKSSRDNDLLSLKEAHPEDWWFHVHGMPGSHVILKRKDSLEPGKKILESAAAIAAYHSKARNAGVVSVACTKVKYVGKPRGAKSGTVSVRRQTLLKVRPAVPE